MQQKEMIMQRHDGNGDVKTWQKREAARFSPADAKWNLSNQRPTQ